MFVIADPCDVPMYDPPLTSTNCVSESSVVHGTTCTFDCNDGYTLETGVTVACSAGTLDQPFPLCNRKYIKIVRYFLFVKLIDKMQRRSYII